MRDRCMPASRTRACVDSPRRVPRTAPASGRCSPTTSTTKNSSCSVSSSNASSPAYVHARARLTPRLPATADPATLPHAERAPTDGRSPLLACLWCCLTAAGGARSESDLGLLLHALGLGDGGGAVQ